MSVLPQQESRGTEEAMDMSKHAPQITAAAMPGLLPVSINNPQQLQEASTAKVATAVSAQDGLSILAATASLEGAASARYYDAAKPARRTSPKLRPIKIEPIPINQVIPETVVTEVAEPTVAPRVAPVPTTVSIVPSSGSPHLTYPAGYMVIPTDQLNTIRMAAQDGAKFVQVIPGTGGVKKIKTSHMIPYPNASSPISTVISRPSPPPNHGSNRVVSSSAHQPTLLYHPSTGSNGALNPGTVRSALVKQEQRVEMMLIDEEQSAGQALVELARGGPPTTTQSLCGHDAVRQKAGEALMDLSQSSASVSEPQATPSPHIFIKGQMYMNTIPSNLPKVVELAQVPLESDFQGKDKDPLRKILKKNLAVKTAMVAGSHPDQVGTASPPVDIASELNMFFNNYYNSDTTKKAQKQIPMKELRHVIPLLVLHCFDMKDHALHKKVKGLWVKPPAGWPEAVPFCDPNNSKQKGELVGKPKKDTLSRMYNYLINKYWEKNGNILAPASVVESVPESVVATEHGYTRSPSPSPGVATTPTLSTASTTTAATSIAHTTQAAKPDTAGAINLTMPKRGDAEAKPADQTPEEDLYSNCEEYNEDYDPLIEVMRRLKGKINLMEQKKLVPDQQYGFMHIIFDLLDKMRGMIQDNLAKRFFLEKVHEFEATVDISKIERSIPKSHREKWHDFEETWQKGKLSSVAFQQEILEQKLDLISKATVVSTIAPEQKSDDMVDLLAKLNIKPYAGTRLAQLLDFDCVEVRFMKAAADVDEASSAGKQHAKAASGRDDDLYLDKLLIEGSIEECYSHDHQDGVLGMFENDNNDSATPFDMNNILLDKNPVDTMIRNTVIFNTMEEVLRKPIKPCPDEDDHMDADSIDGIHVEHFGLQPPIEVDLSASRTPCSASSESNFASQAISVETVTHEFELQSLLSPQIPDTYNYTSELEDTTRRPISPIFDASAGFSTQNGALVDFGSPVQESASMNATLHSHLADKQQVPPNTFSQPILRGLMRAPKRKMISHEKTMPQIETGSPQPAPSTDQMSLGKNLISPVQQQIPEVVLSTENACVGSLGKQVAGYETVPATAEIPTVVADFGLFGEGESANGRTNKRTRFN